MKSTVIRQNLQKKINGVKLNLEDCSEAILSQVAEVDFARFLVWKEVFHLILLILLTLLSRNILYSL